MNSRLLPSRLRAALLRFNETILIATAAAITIIVIYQIVARLGGFSVRWTEELARFFSIWATFLAVPVLLSRQRLISIDVFQLMLPRALQRVLTIVQALVVIVACAVLIWIGFKQVVLTWRQTSPGLLWPMGLFTLPIAVSAVMSLIVLPDWLKAALNPSSRNAAGVGEKHL